MFRISIALCCRFHYNKLYLYTLLKVKESQTMRVTFYTLGCKVNQNETGALAQLFEENGYTVVSNEESADVYIVNSCTVTNFGDQRSRASE